LKFHEVFIGIVAELSGRVFVAKAMVPFNRSRRGMGVPFTTVETVAGWWLPPVRWLPLRKEACGPMVVDLRFMTYYFDLLEWFQIF